MTAIFLNTLLGFGLAVALVPACRVAARRFGIVAHPRDDRWHRQSVPLLGGLAVALAVLLGAFITGVAGDLAIPLAAAMAICLVGLVDDVITLKPATKLIAQIALAGVLVYFGYRLQWLDSRLLDSLLTIFWVVGLTNAFNLLDNMDGLCGGIALVVAVMLLAGLYSGVTSHLAGNEMALLALLAGAAAGFLVFNFPPASIFMGDSGSLLLGFSLAALTLSPEGIRGSRVDVVSVIVGPVFVMLIPIFDTALVTALRMMSGRSPATGGRDHTSHRLVAMGLSERAAVFVLWSLAAMGGVIGTMLRQVEGWSLLAAGLFLVAMCLFAVYLARIKVYQDVGATPFGSVTPIVTEFLYKRRVAEVMLDFCLIAIAYDAAYRLRFEGDDYLLNIENFYQSLPVVLATQLTAFFVVGVYRGVWRHFGLMDGVTIAKGVVLGTAAVQLLILYLYHYFSYSRTVFLIYAVLLAVLVTLSRASFRLMGEFVQRRRHSLRRALIYGAGENAAFALRELRDRQGSTWKIVGFIDDDPWNARTRVHGYPVLGGGDRLHWLVERGGIDAVVLNQHVEGERLTALEELCERQRVALFRLHVEMEELVSTDGPSPAARLRAQLRQARR